MKNFIILLFSLLVLTTACSKKTTNDPDPVPPQNMEDLDIKSGFDWKTTKDIQLTLTARASNIVDVQSDEGKSYQKAFLAADVPYTMKLTVPSYEESVILSFMGKEVNLELNNSTINYEFQ